MSEYKIGDKFEIVKSEYLGKDWGVGSIVELYSFNGARHNTLRFKAPGRKGYYHLTFCIEGEGVFHSVVRPLKTEAQTRNAKLGTGITFKPTGAKGVFWKSSHSVLGEEWYILMADGNILTTTPSQIRLDHEPEYREIPFSEATHEQRMDAINLAYGCNPVVQISHFPCSGYAFTYKGSFDIHTDTNNLTVRIPT